MKKKIKTKVNLQQKIKFISSNLLKIETRNILLKRRISKIPDSIEKYLILKDFHQAEKNFNDNVLEFGMAKFLLKYVQFAEKTIPRGK